MDDRTFDRMARALASTASRRKAALGALAIGATALIGARQSEAQAPAPGVSTFCAGDGQPCVMLTGCCTGFTCVTNAINPNQGFCQAGGSGGVQIAPPMVAANATGSTQPAPTKTPRTHKTHTPGSNHTNTSTNTRPAFQLKVTDLSCYADPANSVVPHITVRNTGTEPIDLGNIKTVINTDTNGGSNGGENLDIRALGRLKPQKSITIDASSRVKLPDGFFSTFAGEGVIVTGESVDGLSSVPSPTKYCESPPAPGTTSAANSRAKKKRRR